MRHWLLRRPPHYTDIHPNAANTPWDYDKVFVDVRLKPGDLVYLTAAADELYGWGHVIKREPYRDQEMQSRVYRVTVTRPVVQQNLVTAAEIKQLEHMRELFTDSNRNLVPLKAVHVNSFNAMLRSTGTPAPADLDSDEPEAERAAKQNFPRIAISPEVAIWLKEAYTRLRNGKQINPTEMLVELWSNLPEDFDYSRIDSRLMRFGVDLTLLGVLHVDAATDLVEKTDQVIRFTRELIRKQPGIGAITSEQVSEELTIPEEDVALIFGLISHLGDFWNGGAGHGSRPGYYSVTIRDEKVKREYLRYRSIDELLEKLAGNGSKPNRVSRSIEASTADNDRQVDVCLSFAGEDRQYVERVAEELRTLSVKVFYDRYEQASLWGKDLYQHLDEMYRKRATFCVIFISRAYSEKLWTKHELRSAQARALAENREYILPVRLDDTELPGVLPTIGYIHDKSPKELAALIIQKLQQAEDRSSVSSARFDIVDSTKRIMLRDGSAASMEQRTAFVGVWSSLIALAEAGRKLWEEVTGEGLAVFADRLREAQQKIATQAIFFSESDYEALEEMMQAADFYLNGKTRLSDIYNGRVETQALNLTVPMERDTFMDQEVRAQIRQNRRWLTRYQNLLRNIRDSLHEQIV
jgi:TIR domain